ncbi:MAG TPA: MerR family transcriptional regulator, partial [Actinocrinis sp.]
QRDLLLRHAERIEAQIAMLRVHLEYLEKKAALWDARDRRDAEAEAEANLRVQGMYPRLEKVLR